MATIDLLASATLATTFIFTVLFATVPNAAVGDYVLFSDQSESLIAGQNLTYDVTPQGLPYGPHTLALGHDCNLVLYMTGKRSWSTDTSVKNGQDCYLTILPDGELILRNSVHYPVWRSGVKSTPGKYVFYLNVFGQLVVAGPEVWTNTDKVTMSETDPAPTTTDYIFYNGQYTMATYGILVTFKNFRLVLRKDCNLVLEDMNSWDVLWETGTKSTSSDCFATLDDFGELFVKHNRREVLWRSGKKSDKKGSVMVLRYDGRLAIYSGVVWEQPPIVYPTEAATAMEPHSMF